MIVFDLQLRCQIMLSLVVKSDCRLVSKATMRLSLSHVSLSYNSIDTMITASSIVSYNWVGTNSRTKVVLQLQRQDQNPSRSR